MLRKVGHYIKNLPRLYQIGGALVILIVGAVGVHFATRAPATPTTPAAITHVQVASVSSLSSAAGPLQVTGKVSSVSEAVILAQTSGEVVTLSHALGDRVSAGGIIAEFENASQQASVLQAQGAYDAAEAALTQAQGTTAQNSGVTAAQATQNAQNTQTAAIVSLQSAYAALDDAVHTKSDALFNQPRGNNPTLILSVPDSQLTTTIQNERVALNVTLASAQPISTDTSVADIDSNVTSMIASAQLVATFESNLVQAVNEAIPNQTVSASAIADYQTSIAAARTEVVSAISSMTAAKGAYDSAASGAVSAANSASSGTQNSIAAATANVEEALGVLDGAKANLEKTIVRSPISGTIVSLPITQGEDVNTGTEVADVSNPGALEVDVYVTSDDAKTLSVGGKALIGDSTTGVITSIAPALDPTTNEIQVKVGITGDQSALTYGDTETVTLTRATAPATSKTPSTSNGILIPIVAAKITPEGPVVFTVSSSTLVAQPITLGDILGDQVTVTSGLSLSTQIVTDARGLSDGQNVIVDSGTSAD